MGLFRELATCVLGVDGNAIPTCPYRAFSDPEIADVLIAYTWFEKGQLALYAGADPEWWFVQAVQAYHTAVLKVRAEEAELERRARGRRA